MAKFSKISKTEKVWSGGQIIPGSAFLAPRFSFIAYSSLEASNPYCWTSLAEALKASRGARAVRTEKGKFMGIYRMETMDSIFNKVHAIVKRPCSPEERSLALAHTRYLVTELQDRAHREPGARARIAVLLGGMDQLGSYFQDGVVSKEEARHIAVFVRERLQALRW